MVVVVHKGITDLFKRKSETNVLNIQDWGLLGGNGILGTPKASCDDKVSCGKRVVYGNEDLVEDFKICYEVLREVSDNSDDVLL